MLSRTAQSLFLVFVAGVGTAEAGRPAPGETPRPNVLLILVDDWGVDKLAAYGASPVPPRTPNIDLLARTGVLFRNAWSNPQCSPTRATILTGRYAFRTGIGEVGSGLGSTPSTSLLANEVLLPRALDLLQTGYRHAITGKWHLGGSPDGPVLVGGFSHASGPINNLPASKTLTAEDCGGIEPGYFCYQKHVMGVPVITSAYATTDQVDDALDWIAQTRESWFLYLPLSAPHAPVHTPPEGLLGAHTLQHLPTDCDAEEPADPRPCYDAAIEAVDTEIGRLIGQLRLVSPDVLSNTLIIVTGDNGTDPLAVVPPFSPAKAKGTISEGGIHVPLICYGAGVVNPGREVDEVVNLVDLYATVVELAAGQPFDSLAGQITSEPIDGQSLAHYLADAVDPGQVRTFAYSERFEPNGPGPYDYFKRTVREKRYKLVQEELSGFAIETFFDLEADPHEQAPIPPITLDGQQLDIYMRLQGALAGLN